MSFGTTTCRRALAHKEEGPGGVVDEHKGGDCEHGRAEELVRSRLEEEHQDVRRGWEPAC